MDSRFTEFPPDLAVYGDVLDLLNRYFHAIYAGDADALRTTFHPECRLFAELKGVPYRKTVGEYIEGVAKRKSPQDLGEAFEMQVLGVDVLETIAHVRTRQQMLGFNYFDYLTLVRTDGQWQIVNKTFVDLAR